ncbi:MAG: YIP1 family protein [Chthoniobacterales bacterium]
MSKIFLNRSRQSLGQFTPEAVSEGLKSGKFLPTDLAWRDGMESWQPLSSLTDLPLAEEEAELPPLPEETEVKVISDEMLIEPAWERRSEIGVFSALAETIKQIFANPSATFAHMKRDGGYWGPLSFLLLVGIPSYIFAVVCITVAQMSILAGSGESQVILRKIYPDKGSIIHMMLTNMLLSPLTITATAFIGAAVIHLFLMISGGARESLKTTFRIYCYVNGAACVLQFIPLCGMYIYFIGAFILLCIALRVTHGTDSWRAVFAVVVPVIFAGIIFMLLFLPLVSTLMPH